MKNAFMIVNPVSGTLKARDSLFTVIDRLTSGGVQPTVRYTRYRGHAGKLAAAAAASGKYDGIICLGGDGTLNEVNCGMISAGVSLPVGYIPTGVTNDFASGLGIPLDPGEAATDVALSMREGLLLPIDTGRFGDSRTFSYIASYGAFSQSSYGAAQSVKNALGYLAYVLHGIGDFFRIRPIHTVCVADGKRIEGDFVFGGVCNTYSVGKIVKLDRTLVDMGDGKLEIVLAYKPNDINEFNRLIAAAASSDLGSDRFVFLRASEISFSLPEGTDWSLDGELAPDVPEVKIGVIPRSLELLCSHGRRSAEKTPKKAGKGENA